MSKKNPQSWIVKDAEGRIFGPFTSEQVLAQIDKGYFVGQEQVAVYPGGRWQSISSTSEFADRLLDALAAEAKPVAAKPSGKSVKSDEFADEKTAIQEPVITPKFANSGQNSPVVTSAPPAPLPSERTMPGTTGGAVIELTDLKELEQKENARPVSKLPIALVVAAILIAGGAYFFQNNENAGQRIRLVAPRKGQSEISEEKIRDKFGKVMASFLTDTFTGYQRAQNDLVEIVEGSPQRLDYAEKKAQALSMLCLVYRELWPYAYQDAKDQKVISVVMQEAKRLDPAGRNGSVCEIVQMIVSGRQRDAQGLTESMLLEQSQAPELFEIRGDLYSYAHDAVNAASYFNQARLLWPAWKKTFVQEARARADQKQYPQAMQLYREVLTAVPNHAVAKIELGLIEYGQFAHVDKGFELLKSAVDSGERVPRQIEAAAYMGLAEIYEKQNQPQKALDYAKKAYALNSSSEKAKEMVVRLGGEKGLKNTKIEGRELMYVGDQYVRSGDCYSAQAQFKAAFEAEPKNGVAAMKAGKCLWKLNQSGEAIEWLKKAISAEPSLTAAYVELADYLAQRYDFTAAVRVLQNIQHLQPQSYEVYRGFALVELRRNNFNGALQFGLRAMKLYENDIETLLIMGKAYIGLRNFQDAQRFAAKAIEIDLNNTEAQSLYAKIEAGLHGIDAGAHYAQELINRFVIAQGQQVPQAVIDYRITLGEIYMQDDRFGHAEESFRQALSLDRNNKRALINLGKVLQARGLAAEALEVFLQAAVLDPSDTDPLFLSGQVYADVGKFKEAVAQFERVVKNNPRYPKAHVQLGRAALRGGDPKRALDEANQERAVNPELADAYLLAGEAYYFLKQYGNCAGEYQKAVSKRAQDATVLVRMARCYRLTGALDSAQSLLRQARAQESGNPDLYKEQGAIFHMKGMADEAKAAYDTYLKLVPNAPDRMEVQMRIQRIDRGDMSLDGG